jgi:hypothetical protein
MIEAVWLVVLVVSTAVLGYWIGRGGWPRWS